VSRAMTLARDSIVQSVREIVTKELARVRTPTAGLPVIDNSTEDAPFSELVLDQARAELNAAEAEVEQAYAGLGESLEMWERAVMEGQQ
jgi:hypothetical protein